MTPGSFQSDGGRDAGVIQCAGQGKFAFQPRICLRTGMPRVGDFEDDGGSVVETRCTVHREVDSGVQPFTNSVAR